MALASSKASRKLVVFPLRFSIMAAPMAILAMFLILASWPMVLNPISSNVGVYIYGVNRRIAPHASSKFDRNAGKDISESNIEVLPMLSESSKEMHITPVDLRRNEMPEKPVQFSNSSSGATEKKVDTLSSSSSNASESNSVESVDSRKNETPEEPVQLSESSSGPTKKKVETSSSVSVTNEELPTSPKDLVDSRKIEMLEKPVDLLESSYGPTEKKVGSSSSASSNTSELNEELPISPKDSVDSRKNEMLEKSVELSELPSGPTEKKVDTSSSTSSYAYESNEELPTFSKYSVDSRKIKMPEKPVELLELSSGPTEKKVDTSSSTSSNASESNEDLPISPKHSVDSRKNEMPEKPVELSELSSGPTEKKVDTSSSASSYAYESNEELPTFSKYSVDSRKIKMSEKPMELLELSSGPTEKKVDTSSYASSNSFESNEELPTSPKDSVDSRKIEMSEKPVELSESSSGPTEKKMDTSSSASSNASEYNEEIPTSPRDSVDSRKNEMSEKPMQLSEPLSAVDTFSSTSKINSIDSVCDLYHGKWFYDPRGPLYTNSSCPIITQMQNCQGNLRPDKEYENWRWKPSQCDLPRFDAKKFLELMRGKTLAFIGDSVARNQMESLMCLLWQVEVPRNRGNRRMHRWYFKSTSVMIVRKWSSWLVHETTEKFGFAPEGVTKLHLDAPDYGFLGLIPNFDVIIFSSGHWFNKQSVYVLNNEIVGGQLWWPDQSRPMKVNNIDAFEISVETILSAMVTHPNYTGLTIVRSFSPDHYEGGAWNTGGSCTGKVKPLATGELVENGFTNIMYKKQMKGFERAVKKATNKSKLKLMDITKAFEYRHDGHPGPYRSPDPNKITKVGKDGKLPPQDCLHWCMPGPVDTWNELVLEIIRREFEGHQTQV